jgi:hypothetical protein
VILFRFMKKNCYICLFIYAKIKNLKLNCILCGSLVNRIFGERRAVLFGSICLPIFQILRMCDIISFDEKNCYISLFIYAQTKTHVELHFVWFVIESDFRRPKSSFCSDLSIFQNSKFFGGCDFISFDEKNCYFGQFIYARKKNSRSIAFCVIC